MTKEEAMNVRQGDITPLLETVDLEGEEFIALCAAINEVCDQKPSSLTIAAIAVVLATYLTEYTYSIHVH